METNLTKAVRELLAVWDSGTIVNPYALTDVFGELVDRLRAGVAADDQLVAALHVVRLDPRHNAWMVENDPQCLAQVEAALRENGVDIDERLR